MLLSGTLRGPGALRAVPRVHADLVGGSAAGLVVVVGGAAWVSTYAVLRTLDTGNKRGGPPPLDDFIHPLFEEETKRVLIFLQLF